MMMMRTKRTWIIVRERGLIRAHPPIRTITACPAGAAATAAGGAEMATTAAVVVAAQSEEAGSEMVEWAAGEVMAVSAAAVAVAAAVAAVAASAEMRDGVVQSLTRVLLR